MNKIGVALSAILAAVIVTIGGAPAHADSWAPLIPKYNKTWAQCSVITYRSNRLSSPLQYPLWQAIRQMEAQTGLDFQQRDSGRVDFKISLLPHNADPRFRSGEALAYASPLNYAPLGRHWVIDSAFLVADRDVMLTTDIAFQRAAFMHELGHAVGLGHVNDAGQIMNGPGIYVRSWGSGDLDGLHTLYPKWRHCR